MNKRKWIILDLGNVIINNDPLLAFVYYLAFKKIKEKCKTVTFHDIMDQRIEFHSKGITEGIFYYIAEKHLSREEINDFKKEYKSITYKKLDYFFPFIIGSRSFCERLSKNYSLGIVANQPSEIRQHLDKNSYSKYFDFIGISEEISMQKPNIEIFKWALDKTGAEPQDIYYIGDTIFNDIIPANSLGINTILLRHNAYRKGFKPKNKYEGIFLECQEKIDKYVFEQAKHLDFHLSLTLTYDQILYYLGL